MVPRTDVAGTDLGAARGVGSPTVAADRGGASDEGGVEGCFCQVSLDKDQCLDSTSRERLEALGVPLR